MIKHSIIAYCKQHLQPGDILVRKGAAKVFGFINFSEIICNITKCKYSHASLVYSTDPVIRVADVNSKGLRDQRLIDWLDDVHSNEFLILRAKSHYLQNGEDHLSNILEFIEAMFDEDPEYNFTFIGGVRELYCTQLIFLAYLNGNIKLAESIPLNKLPGWKWFHNISFLFKIKPWTPIFHAGQLLNNDMLDLITSVPVRL